MGAVKGLQGVVRVNGDAQLEARHRAEWPALWERIDRLADLVDW